MFSKDQITQQSKLDLLALAEGTKNKVQVKRECVKIAQLLEKEPILDDGMKA